MKLMHTILIASCCMILAQPAQAADEKATAPFDIKTRNPADSVKVGIEKDAVTLDAHSPGGIGGATITLTEDKWPTSIVLRLHLRGLEAFSVSNGNVSLNGSVTSHSGHPRRLRLTKDGKAQRLEPGTEIKVLDAAGKPVNGLPGDGGYFEIVLPKALLPAEMKNLTIGLISSGDSDEAQESLKSLR